MMKITNTLHPPLEARLAEMDDLFVNESVMVGKVYVIRLKKQGTHMLMRTFEHQDGRLLKDAIKEGRVYVNKIEP